MNLMELKRRCDEVHGWKYIRNHDWDGQFDAFKTVLRRHAKGHHAFPIIVIAGDMPPVCVGEPGYHVDRHRGKTKRYICSTRAIHVGCDWIEEHYPYIAEKLLAIYHQTLLGVEP